MRIRLPEGSITLSRSPAVHLAIGFVLVLPFILLEVFVAGASLAHFPFPLFGLLLFLGVSFSVIVRPLASAVVVGERDLTVLTIMLRAVLLICVALLWITLVVDQMPCFLGVPNCD